MLVTVAPPRTTKGSVGGEVDLGLRGGGDGEDSQADGERDAGTPGALEAMVVGHEVLPYGRAAPTNVPGSPLTADATGDERS